METPYPILEFDPERKAVIEPEEVVSERDLPEFCVISFFHDLVEKFRNSRDTTPLKPMIYGTGKLSLYSVEQDGCTICIAPAAVGAPLAAGLFEEMIARGGRKFIVHGSCGVLDSSIESGAVIVPTSAVRDEGTSYHYLPPSRVVPPSSRAVIAIKQTLDEAGVGYIEGRTWSTDAFYRETPGKVVMRKSEGCITVEMEAAAYFAVARFRGVQLGQILYGGDDVSGSQWDPRDLGRKIPARETIFNLSIDACLKL